MLSTRLAATNIRCRKSECLYSIGAICAVRSQVIRARRLTFACVNLTQKQFPCSPVQQVSIWPVHIAAVCLQTQRRRFRCVQHCEAVWVPVLLSAKAYGGSRLARLETLQQTADFKKKFWEEVVDRFPLTVHEPHRKGGKLGDLSGRAVEAGRRSADSDWVPLVAGLTLRFHSRQSFSLVCLMTCLVTGFLQDVLHLKSKAVPVTGRGGV
jgi:hypothetical protein